MRWLPLPKYMIHKQILGQRKLMCQRQGIIFLPTQSTVAVYDPATDTWEKKAEMPTRRCGLSTIVLNGKIYAIGGFDNDAIKLLPTVEVYNPKFNRCEKKADMPTARCCFAASVVNGKIYAIGGIANIEAEPLVYRIPSRRRHLDTKSRYAHSKSRVRQ